jgi:hypothetical protein
VYAVADVVEHAERRFGRADAAYPVRGVVLRGMYEVAGGAMTVRGPYLKDLAGRGDRMYFRRGCSERWRSCALFGMRTRFLWSVSL